MKAIELVGSSDWEIEHSGFRLKNSHVIWESATYSPAGKIVITRVVDAKEGGKPFLMELNYKKRYIHPDTEIILIPK